MDTTDLALELVYQAAIYADYRQTRIIAEHPDLYYEKNPILGEHPTSGRVKNYFIASAITHFAINYFLPPSAGKNIWLGVTIAFQYHTVHSNLKLGLKF